MNCFPKIIKTRKKYTIIIKQRQSNIIDNPVIIDSYVEEQERLISGKIAHAQLEHILITMNLYLNPNYYGRKPTSIDIMEVIHILPKTIDSNQLLSNIIDKCVLYNLITSVLFQYIKIEYPEIFLKYLELKQDTLMYNNGISRIYCIQYPKTVITKLTDINNSLLQYLVFDCYNELPNVYYSIYKDELIRRNCNYII